MKALEDFGIKLNWKFDFRVHGSTLEPLPNTMFVDVGNKLTEGIIDTHQGTKYKSSAHALSENPHLVLNHLLKGLNEAYARGEIEHLDNLKRGIEFTFVTHKGPDWDSIATFYLCDHLLRTGKFPCDWLEHQKKTVIELLVEATNQIDQGKAKMEGEIKRPFIIYYDMSDGKRLDSEEQLKHGRQLIEDILDAVKEEKIKCQENPILEHFEDLEKRLPAYQEHINRLTGDKELYEQDLKHSEIFDVELPYKNPENVPEFEMKTALAFTKEPKCKLHKYWVRDRGEDPGEPQLLLIPNNNDETEKPTRWIISVDPNKKHNLQRLGYCLERQENAVRGDEHKRHGEPRGDDADYSDNSDPWYDGRDHDHTIVDGPAGGTMLELKKIKYVLKERFHGIRLEEHPNDILTFYFFFEIPTSSDTKQSSRNSAREFLEKNGMEKNPVLKEVTNAFQFIKDIKLWVKNCELPAENNFKGTVWASEITRHCVLRLKVKDLHKTIRGQADTPLILEELPQTVEEIEKQAKETAEGLLNSLQLKSKIWGTECFRLLVLKQPDLKFHSKDKVKNVFGQLLRDELSKERIDRLMEGKGTEQLRTSHALCVLNEDPKNNTIGSSSQRQLMLFFSLFLKTGYRNFSERIGKIVDDMIKPEREESEQDSALMEIQEDYSAFLGKYEFSAREINTDDGLQNFFEIALKAIGFSEQQEETRHEMTTTFQLAAAKNRKKIEEGNKVLEKGNRMLNCLILGFGILALGDFGYAWWAGSNEKIVIGFYVIAGLISIAIFAVLWLWKYSTGPRR